MNDPSADSGQAPTPPPPPPPVDPNASMPTPPPVDPATQQASAPIPQPVIPTPETAPAQSAAAAPVSPMPPPPAGQTPAVGSASPLMGDDELSEDQFITGGDDHSFITAVPVPAHPNTQFDEKKFLALLAGSISLTKTEKQRIIESIPKLSQHQIDELMRIFTEEQTKFAELNNKHADQLKALEANHKNDWNDIEHQAKQEEAKKKDDEDADALRAKLGL